MLRNSLVVMLATSTLGVVVICSLAAFVFARMDFRGKGWVFNLFTLGLMFPINIAILPVYFVLRQLGSDRQPLGCHHRADGIPTIRQHHDLARILYRIPAELQDAAYIDGCTAFDFFWRILLPLASPAWPRLPP
jgi:raffinose/stachyose/melibiose transport system permease protein